MRGALWSALRDARYALPGWIERTIPGPGPRSAARTCARLQRQGLGVSLGYFQAHDADPDAIVAASLAVAARIGDDAILAVKAPPMRFDEGRLRGVAAAGIPIVLDAHAPRDADATLALVRDLEQDFPGTGCAIPARWTRSLADALALRDTSARLRVVKGEWPDLEAGDGDIAARYLAVVRKLAGRSAPVAIATHDPALAEAALTILLEAGTPCELEQLRGLPSRRTTAVARRLGARVRVYVPFGPGWWPYAIDKALARPYLPRWWLADRLGLAA